MSFISFKIARRIFHWQNSWHWEGKVASNPQWVGGKRSKDGIGPFAKSKCCPCSKDPLSRRVFCQQHRPWWQASAKAIHHQTADLYLLHHMDFHDVTVSLICQKGHRVRGKRTRDQIESENVCTKWHICKVIVLSLRSDACSQPTQTF